MPKYYCEYCDIYLTHSSAGGRRQHNSGRKHINNKIEYYQTLIREKNLTPPMYPVPPHLAAAIRPPMMSRPMPMHNVPPMPLPGMTPIPGGATRPHVVLPGQIRPVAAPMQGGKIGGTNWVTNWGGKTGGQVGTPMGGKGAPIAAPNPFRPQGQAGKGQPFRPPIVLPGQNGNNPPGQQMPITSKIIEAPKGILSKGPPGGGKTGFKQSPMPNGLSDKGPGKFGGGKSPSMMGKDGKNFGGGGKSPGMMGKDFKGGKIGGGGKFPMQQQVQPGKGKW